MCRRRDARAEGIRFLDEEPRPAAPSPSAPPPKGRKRREWPVGVLSFLAVVGVGLAIHHGEAGRDASAREVIDRRFEVGPRPRVEVEASDGSVRVERGEGDAVRCRIEVQASGATEEEARRMLGRIRPLVVGGMDSVRVRVDPAGGPRWSGRVEVRLEVPEGADVRVAARDGSVRVEDVRGSVAVRTTNGRIEVEEATGPIVLESSNGAIECEADNALISARTSNGSISFQGSLAEGTSRLVTENGSVSLELPEHARYRIDASSRNGRVESDFPIDVGGIDRVALAGIDGEEPATRVEVRTTNGAIRVERD